VEGEDVKDDDGDSGCGKGRTGVTAIAETDAKQPEGVDRGDDKGEAVDSGDGSEARQHGIVYLSDDEEQG
jgi:hypothetical protein